MATKKPRLIVPCFYLYFHDDTEYWSEDTVQRAGGRIVSVYFFNALRVVRGCELTPSYEMFFLESYAPDYPPEPAGAHDCHDLSSAQYEVSDWEREREDFLEELRSVDYYASDVTYVHTSDVDLRQCKLTWKLTAKTWRGILADNGGDAEYAYDAACEHLREQLSGNPEW
jgi:hypothetical protein